MEFGGIGVTAPRWGPSPQVICSAWLWGALGQLDGVCGDVTDVARGHSSAPSLAILGKAARDHYIHFWG